MGQGRGGKKEGGMEGEVGETAIEKYCTKKNKLE